MPSTKPALPILRSAQRKGDVAEFAFLARAIRFGLNLCKPLNSNCRYDVLVDAAGRYSRVQIKSGWAGPKRSAYVVRIVRRRAGYATTLYRSTEADFFAAYVAAQDAWYIVPYRAVVKRTQLTFYPHRPRSRGRLEKYREAWDLFLPKGMVIPDLKACADPEYLQAPGGV